MVWRMLADSAIATSPLDARIMPRPRGEWNRRGPRGHSSVRAQQIDRRLPAFHSGSWNQV